MSERVVCLKYKVGEGETIRDLLSGRDCTLGCQARIERMENTGFKSNQASECAILKEFHRMAASEMARGGRKSTFCTSCGKNVTFRGSVNPIGHSVRWRT